MTHAHRWIINQQKSELGYCRGCGTWRRFLADFEGKPVWRKAHKKARDVDAA